jgi:hypothetical protein
MTIFPKEKPLAATHRCYYVGLRTLGPHNVRVLVAGPEGGTDGQVRRPGDPVTTRYVSGTRPGSPSAGCRCRRGTRSPAA